MREIKLRVWFIDGASKTLPGQICSMQEDRTLLEFLKDIEDVKQEHGYEVILIQYTGLKDKNGKEIFEGDIIKSSNGNIYQTKWYEEGAMFLGFGIGKVKGFQNLNAEIFKYVEIIGNIYENSELLKEQI